MKTRIVVCLLIGTAAGWLFHLFRDFRPEHALLLGLAIAALTYSTLRAIDNLRSGSRQVTPGHEQERDDQ